MLSLKSPSSCGSVGVGVSSSSALLESGDSGKSCVGVGVGVSCSGVPVCPLRQSVVSSSYLSDVVMWCGRTYGFDGGAALSLLSSSSGKVSSKVSSSGKVSSGVKVSVVVVKPLFALPFSGVEVSSCCSALRKNGGLYTQCTKARAKSFASFCDGCAKSALDNGGVPEYGTISGRLSVPINSYVDPKGNKPVPYVSVMNKLKVSRSEVEAEGERCGVEVPACHFDVVVGDRKRGRPKKVSVVSECDGVKVVGKKGRPRKSSKVVEVMDDSVDLFAELVSLNAAAMLSESDSRDMTSSCVSPLSAHDEEESSSVMSSEDAGSVLSEDAGVAMLSEDAVAMLSEDAGVAVSSAKSSKESAKAEKASAKASKEAAKEAAKAAKEAAKASKEEAKEAAKAEKASAKASKSSKSAKSEVAPVVDVVPVVVEVVVPAAAVSDSSVEGDVVKKFVYDGKTYLRSKSSGVVYDYDAYKLRSEQVMVGKWDSDRCKVTFEEYAEEEEEEEEEEYEDDDE